MSLKPQSAKRVIKALSTLGFKIVRKRGSHVVLKHVDGRLTVVPVHAGEEIGTGLLYKIIKRGIHQTARNRVIRFFHVCLRSAASENRKKKELQVISPHCRGFKSPQSAVRQNYECKALSNRN